MRHRRGLPIVAVILGCYAWLAWGSGPALLVVPPSDIILSHFVHADFGCTDCHTGIEASNSAGDKNLPTMDVCGMCHDVEDFETCGSCHRNAEEPGGSPNPDRPILFDHGKHLAQKTACLSCHGDMSLADSSPQSSMPKMALCLDCHDGTKANAGCALCHGQRINLADIHPSGWLRSHGDRVATDREWCRGCHKRETFCIQCHRGDNLTGSVHDLNYVYTHGLDAKSREKDCTRCHDNKSFCNDCHRRENRIPLLHSKLTWLADHGRAARSDIENCASCHDSSDPTCARSGCHADFDGVRGTDPGVHPRDVGRFEARGPWHDDRGCFCYQCHLDTGIPGSGFCGYCHR